MRQLTQREVQKVSVDILQRVHDFCMVHNLRYSLAYGTLIGAIRHHGFIPWDDDVDIVMPRADYDYLIRHYKMESTKIFAQEIGNSYINYARVCDMESTVVKAYTPWASESTGVWIDIFPIDGLLETKDSFLSKIEELQKKDALLFQVRGAKKAKLGSNIIKNIKIIGKRVLYGKYSLGSVIKVYNAILNTCDFETCEFCGQVAYPVYIKKEFQIKKNYSEYIDIEFEGRQFKCVKYYDAVLRNYYNDYMKLPPLDQQVPKHSEHKIYWKK